MDPKDIPKKGASWKYRLQCHVSYFKERLKNKKKKIERNKKKSAIINQNKSETDTLPDSLLFLD